MPTVGLKSVLKVAPSLNDIINLPPGQLALYMTGATTVGFVYHMGVTRSLRWMRKRLGKGSDLEIRDESAQPRLLVSALLHSSALYSASFLFEYLYPRLSILPKAVAGITWCMRKMVFLPGDAPYGELSGGSAAANVLVTTFEVERIFCSLIPIPSVGMLGVNVQGLTAEQTAEVFAPIDGCSDGHPLRFFTPSRLIRVGLQVGFATTAVALIRRYVIPRLIGVPNRLRQPSDVPNCCAIPFSLLSALAIVRDAESISLFGTRWRVGLVGVFLLTLLPSCVLMEVLHSYLFSAPALSEEQPEMFIQELAHDVLPGVPIRHMSRQEIGTVQESLYGSVLRSIYFGDTAGFVGNLAALTTVVTIGNTANAEPLSAYEKSLERINADIEDEVFERQASLESVADDSADTCPICLRAERPVSQDMLRVKVCGHEFHTECLASWLDQSTECPLCRTHIDRQLPPDAQRDLERWLSMPEEVRDEFLASRCVTASNLVFDALTLLPINTADPIRSASLYMSTIEEFSKILDSAQTLNLGQKESFLLGMMCDIITEINQGLSNPIIITAEGMLGMMIAPCSPDTLLSGTFCKSQLINSIPISPGVRKVLLWMHFHF